MLLFSSVGIVWCTVSYLLYCFLACECVMRLGNDQFEDFSEEPTVGEGFEQQQSWEEGKCIMSCKCPNNY